MKKTAVAVLLVLLMILSLAGCASQKESKEFISFNGKYYISRDEARFYAAQLQSMNQGVDLTSAVHSAAAKEALYDMLENNFLIMEWAEDEMGLSADKGDVVDEIDKLITDSIAAMGKKEFEARLAQSGFTIDSYRKIMIESSIKNDIAVHATGENGTLVEITPEQRLEYIAEKPVYAAKHILINAENGNFDAALEKINGIKAELDAGADFDTLMNRHCEDPGVRTNPNGYAFVTGEMVPEFEQTVKDTGIGQISEPFKTTYGYHIVLRVEVDEKFDISGMIINDRIEKILDSYRTGITVQYCEGYDDLTFAEIMG